MKKILALILLATPCLGASYILFHDTVKPDSSVVTAQSIGGITALGTQGTVTVPSTGVNPIVQIDTAVNSALTVLRNSNDSGAPITEYLKRRSGFTVVQNGDILGIIRFSGADGVDMAAGADLRAFVSGSPGSDDMPTSIGIYTSNDGTASPSLKWTVTSQGNLEGNLAGNGVSFKEGSNARMGTATLDGGSPGTVTVANTSVTANTRIFLTGNADGGTPGWVRVSARVAATSFTITSSANGDTSTVAWLLVEPSP